MALLEKLSGVIEETRVHRSRKLTHWRASVKLTVTFKQITDVTVTLLYATGDLKDDRSPTQPSPPIIFDATLTQPGPPVTMDALPALPPVIRTILQNQDLREELLKYRCNCSPVHANLCRKGGLAISFCVGSRVCPIPKCQLGFDNVWNLRRHFGECFKKHCNLRIDVE